MKDTERLNEILAPLQTMEERLTKVRNMRDNFISPEYSRIMDRAIEGIKAKGSVSQALKVGDAAPEFELPDLIGANVSSRSLLDKGPLLINFFRGNWCPFCNIELHGIQKAQATFTELGASTVAVSPQLPEGFSLPGTEGGFSFPILYDRGNHVASLFGIVDELPDELVDVYEQLGHSLLEANGQTAARQLPLPATFVVSKTGTIALAFVDGDYSHRQSIAGIVSALRSTS